MTVENFGEAPDGSMVHRARLRGGGLSVDLLSWGAVVQDIRLEGHGAPLVLGFERLEDYLQHSPYFGATAGRYANRVRDGRFSIDGVAYQADRNFLGKHLLHGGAGGIGKRNWRFASVTGDSATLVLTDPDGVMGFPGDCHVSARFSLPGEGQLAIAYEAVTTRPTLVNLAHHSYFVLDNSGSILDHAVRVDSDAYLPVDEEMIPTGEVRPVAGTAFDFRKARPVRCEENGAQVIYDHNFCISGSRQPIRAVAAAHSPVSGVSLEVFSTEPGVQFYAGHKLNPPVPGLGGRRYGAFAGFCFEPQVWPDSPNHPHFPQALLRPGEQYRQQSVFKFSHKS
jgi:aldose 1-epimerase